MASLDNFRLVVFRAVAEQRSFRKAAEELYLSQPAVSLQIKALEEDMGVQLFHRAGAHIALTEAGEILLSYARQSSALLAQAEQEIARLRGEVSGKLALGASTTIAQYVLPRLLSEFLQEHPRVQLSVTGGNTEQIVEALESRRIALGLIEGPTRSRDVKSEAFLEDDLVLIVPAVHKWAKADSIPFAELAATPFLMRERGSGTRRVVEMALERVGLRLSALHIAMELDSTEAIKSAVEAGLGVGFVSRWSITKDQRLGAHFKIVDVAGLRIQRQFRVAHAAGAEPQGLANEFRRFLFARAGVRRAAIGARVSASPRVSSPTSLLSAPLTAAGVPSRTDKKNK